MKNTSLEKVSHIIAYANLSHFGLKKILTGDSLALFFEMLKFQYPWLRIKDFVKVVFKGAMGGYVYREKAVAYDQVSAAPNYSQPVNSMTIGGWIIEAIDRGHVKEPVGKPCPEGVAHVCDRDILRTANKLGYRFHDYLRVYWGCTYDELNEYRFRDSEDE